MRAPSLALWALLLTGCPKPLERVAGTDDSRLDAASARLEELGLQERSEHLSCLERCDMARQSCEVTLELCGLVQAHPERSDLPRRCLQAREQCAQAQGGCARCRRDD